MNFFERAATARLAVAQIQPAAGDFDANVGKHLQCIDVAVSHGAQLIFFPELSLAGYEPKLAKHLAMTQDDPRFEVFQKSSDAHGIVIGVGAPTLATVGIRISSIVFQPKKARLTYSKQQLHSDEMPFFVCGDEPMVLKLGAHTLAPAICYESLQPEHGENAKKLGADIYLASVAKSDRGVAKAYAHYPAMARQHSMIVLMANCLGPCDDFVGVGQSAAWNRRGELVGRIEGQQEGMVLVDTGTETATVLNLEP